MSDGYFSFDGYNAPVSQAIAALNAGDPDLARQVIHEARLGISPRTIPQMPTYKGAPARPFSHPEIDKYRELDGYLSRIESLLGSGRNDSAKAELEALKIHFGWQ